MKRGRSFFREYLEAIVIALLLAVGARTYVVEAFEIPSESMVPTFLVGDRLMVDKAVYRFRGPQRNEIIVFKDPEDAGRILIKRVIGLPGEKLEVRNRVVYINDAPLNADFHAFHNPFDLSRMEVRDDFGPVTIPSGKYFMMGDNRENSKDSRFWGYLDRDLIIGRAFVIYWSRDAAFSFPSGIRFDRFGLLVDY
jgi:signal peptidase I